MTQGQMFPMSEEERIAILRGNLASDVEKRLAKRDAAAVALADAQEAEDGARGLLSVFDSMVRECDRAHAAAATAVDPITGEVTSKDRFSDPPAGKIGARCPDCDGDGRIPDKTGGGRHGSCRTCQGSGSIQPAPAVSCAEVLVAWPDNLDMQRIEVGPLTRYGELAAKFLNSLPNDDPRRSDAFTDYRIVDVDAGSERDPHATIVAADYGLEFSVELGAALAEATTP